MGKKKKKRTTSGPTQTYADRVAAGRAPCFVWLSPEAVDALERLLNSGMSKTEAINAGLVALARGGFVRSPTKGPAPVEDDPEEAEELAEQERRPPPRGTVLVPSGSPAELAERVRARGARRKATELGR